MLTFSVLYVKCGLACGPPLTSTTLSARKEINMFIINLAAISRVPVAESLDLADCSLRHSFDVCLASLGIDLPRTVFPQGGYKTQVGLHVYFPARD